VWILCHVLDVDHSSCYSERFLGWSKESKDSSLKHVFMKYLTNKHSLLWTTGF